MGDVAAIHRQGGRPLLHKLQPPGAAHAVPHVTVESIVPRLVHREGGVGVGVAVHAVHPFKILDHRPVRPAPGDGKVSHLRAVAEERQVGVGAIHIKLQIHVRP